MNSASKVLVAAIVLAGATLQAQTYFDANDITYGAAATGDPNNLFDASVPAVPLLNVNKNGDAIDSWTYWDIFPAASAWNINLYDFRYSQSDPDGIQRISIADGTYQVKVYGVYPENPSSRYGATFSFDGGTTWFPVDNQTNPINWVDNSSELGAPLAAASGDTRFWSWIPTTVTVTGGSLDILIRAPELLQNGQAQDRFFLDGFALQVPEPTTFALAGLGAAALIIFRRRS